jgi:hypothetical protein
MSNLREKKNLSWIRYIHAISNINEQDKLNATTGLSQVIPKSQVQEKKMGILWDGAQVIYRLQESLWFGYQGGIV